MAGAIPFSEYVQRFGKLATTLNTDLDRDLDAAAPLLKAIMQAATMIAKPASPRGGRGAVATGAYLASWKAVRANQGGSKGILISNDAKYMAVIENGRAARAKMPPLDKIAKWAQVRLGYGEAEAKRAAWPIARAIKARGLQARGVMTSQQMQRQLKRFMELRISKAIAVTTRKVMGV